MPPTGLSAAGPLLGAVLVGGRAQRLWLWQYCIILMRRLRSQKFRQMKQKAQAILCALTSVFVKYDGIYASKRRAKPQSVNCAVLSKLCWTNCVYAVIIKDSDRRLSRQDIYSGRRLLIYICGYGGTGRHAGFRSCHLSDGISGRLRQTRTDA